MGLFTNDEVKLKIDLLKRCVKNQGKVKRRDRETNIDMYAFVKSRCDTGVLQYATWKQYNDNQGDITYSYEAIENIYQHTKKVITRLFTVGVNSTVMVKEIYQYIVGNYEVPLFEDDANGLANLEMMTETKKGNVDGIINLFGFYLSCLNFRWDKVKCCINKPEKYGKYVGKDECDHTIVRIHTGCGMYYFDPVRDILLGNKIKCQFLALNKKQMLLSCGLLKSEKDEPSKEEEGMFYDFTNNIDTISYELDIKPEMFVKDEEPEEEETGEIRVVREKKKEEPVKETRKSEEKKVEETKEEDEDMARDKIDTNSPIRTVVEDEDYEEVIKIEKQEKRGADDDIFADFMKDEPEKKKEAENDIFKFDEIEVVKTDEPYKDIKEEPAKEEEKEEAVQERIEGKNEEVFKEVEQTEEKATHEEEKHEEDKEEQIEERTEEDKEAQVLSEKEKKSEHRKYEGLSRAFSPEKDYVEDAERREAERRAVRYSAKREEIKDEIKHEIEKKTAQNESVTDQKTREENREQADNTKAIQRRELTADEEERKEKARERVATRNRQPMLVNIKTQEKIYITDFPFTIGRSMDNDYMIDNKFVSTRHCVINQHDGCAWLEDLGSSNGSYVDKQKLGSEEVQLFDGARVKLANEVFKYYE